MSTAAPAQKKGGDSAIMLLKNIVFLLLSNWIWFVLSLIISLGIAVYYLKSTPPVYERAVSILIKSHESSGEAWMEDLGLSTVSSNLTNEMEIMKTAVVSNEIARRLKLNVEYHRKGSFHDDVLYGLECPVKVTFLDLQEDRTASFVLDCNSVGELSATEFKLGGAKLDTSLKLRLNDTVDSPLGKLVVELTDGSSGNVQPFHLDVIHSNMQMVANDVQRKLVPKLRQKGSTIINISYRDISKARAEDVLNTLVGVYNETWIKDRNVKTSNTDKFIKERLSFIEQELGDVEQSISVWKSENLMLNVSAAGSFAQSQVNEAEGRLQMINDQVYMTRYIRDYLTDGRHDHQLLPANSGITNSNIEKLIGEYNNLLLRRNNHLANSSLQNPLVRDLDEQLATLQGSILQSLDYELSMLQAKANSVRSQRSQAVSKIATNPEKAQQLLSVERQQKVKEELYLYLLKRREENELSQAFGAYNNQLIESPFGSSSPVLPNTTNTFLMAVVLGLLVPGILVVGKDMLNTKVRGRKDLESLSAPYAGDVPLYEPKGKKKNKKKMLEDEHTEILVKEKTRDVINEAFRVIRTNLEFILGFNGSNHVVMLTSVNPGSGKTFITANLSTALAIRDKKVLVIDLDLRKGSMSRYVGRPKHGVSNYLSGQESDYRKLIVNMGKVHVLPCGSLPPNPAELLISPKFRALIEEVRGEYDYVFLDCPPVEVVADASIISRYTDLTLFVVRVGKLERDYIPEIEEWYNNKKFGSLSILLNGIERTTARYGYHKYGYHYGSYGYGYGEK